MCACAFVRVRLAGRQFHFPAGGVFPVTEQFELPPNVAIVGAANPTPDAADRPRQQTDVGAQTWFVIPRSAALCGDDPWCRCAARARLCGRRFPLVFAIVVAEAAVRDPRTSVRGRASALRWLFVTVALASVRGRGDRSSLPPVIAVRTPRRADVRSRAAPPPGRDATATGRTACVGDPRTHRQGFLMGNGTTLQVRA